jgi:metal-sulfur cluster biosynthetic enzyme
MMVGYDSWTLIPDDAIEAESWAWLLTVLDPEIGINLVDLGLIYGLTSSGGHVKVTMTLTTPGCPMSDSMPPAVQRVLETVPGVKDVDVDLVWDPPWDPDRMTHEAKRLLGWRDQSTNQ